MATSTLDRGQQMDFDGLALVADEVVVDRVRTDEVDAAALTATGPITLATYTVATVPAAASNTGAIIYVSNGADGSPTIAWSNGTSWIEEDGTAIAGA